MLNLKPFITLAALVTITSSFSFGEDTLTGDTKLSCEAIMCLSTPSRPSECEPSLQRYFSITAKKASEVAQKRKNFLELCPKDQSTSSNEKGTN